MFLFRLLSADVIPSSKNIEGTSKKKVFKKSKTQSVELDSKRLKAYGVSTKKLKRLLYNKKKDAKNLKPQE